MAHRLLLLVTDLEIGGTPTVVRELAPRLVSPGHIDVTVACLKPAGPVAAQIVSRGVSVRSFEARHTWQLPGVVRALRRFVDERQITTVFSFLVHANTVAALASRGAPLVRWFQSIQTTQPYPRWHWWLQRRMQGQAKSIAVPSQSVADFAISRGIDKSKIAVIPNAIDPASFDGKPAPAREDWTGQVRVGFIGRLDPIKRLPDLISAMQLLPSRFSLTIYGDGAQRGELEALVAVRQLSQRVRFAGSVPSPIPALREIDLLVLPSAAEGFPLVPIEAMMMHVPVVGTNVPGIRDVIQSQQTGLLVPVGNSGEIARAIERLSNQPELRQRLTECAHSDVLERFTWDKVLLAYHRFLELTQ